MTIKQYSDHTGLPMSVIRNLCRRELCKRVVHRFDDGRTAPIYIDSEGMDNLIKKMEYK